MASAPKRHASASAEPSSCSSPETASGPTSSATVEQAKTEPDEDTNHLQEASTGSEEYSLDENNNAQSTADEQPGSASPEREKSKQELADDDDYTGDMEDADDAASDEEQEQEERISSEEVEDARESGDEDKEDDEQEDEGDDQDESEQESEEEQQDETPEGPEDDENSEGEESGDQAEEATPTTYRQAAGTESEKEDNPERLIPKLSQNNADPIEDEEMADAAADNASSPSLDEDADMTDHSEHNYIPAAQHRPEQNDEMDPVMFAQLQAHVRTINSASSFPLGAPAAEKGRKFWKTVEERLPHGYDSAAHAVTTTTAITGNDPGDIDMDDSDVEAGKEYHQAEQEMAKKRKRGMVSQADQFELIRLKQRYENAMRRARNQQKHEAYEAVGQDESEDDEPLGGTSLFVAPHEERTEQPPPKKQKKGRQTAPRKPRAKPAAVKTQLTKARSKKLSAKEQKAQREGDLQTNLTGGGLHTNLFDDVEANDAREEQPTFSTATAKPDALREMLASIPDEMKKKAQRDKIIFGKHLRYFTPSGSCRSNGQGGWKVFGLRSALSPYQVIGVGWMRKQETQSDGNENAVPGGLVADAMGLGKTVMCIANIVNGRPKDTKVCKTTLIVVPTSLVNQWKEEILKHAMYIPSINNKGIKQTGLHFSKNRLTDVKCTPEEAISTFKKFEIIITTYSEVRREFPKFKPPPNLRTKDEKLKWWNEMCNQNPGPLHSMTFHRVILDEATAIKNHMSATSMACRAIKAKYRWAVTGTPIQNNTTEFYPYFKFLRVPNTGSFKIFKQNYCDFDNSQGRERLYHVLRTFMLRRNHTDELMGSKLLPLPKPTQQTSHLYFTKIEAEIYQIVHSRFVERINGLSESGQLRKHYGHILAMITRLRQMTCHPLLLQDTMRDLLEREDFDALRELAARPIAECENQAAILSHLRRMLSKKREDLEVVEPDAISRKTQVSNTIILDDEPPENASTDPTPIEIPSDSETFTTGKAFAQTDSTHLFLAELETQQPLFKEHVIKCPRCKSTAKQPMHLDCGHSYCNTCVATMSFEAGKVTKSDKPHCLLCRTTMVPTANGKLQTAASTMQSGGTLIGHDDKKPKKKGTKEIVDSWVDAEGNMVPSTKTTAVKAQILAWKEEQPGVKIVIYTQFLTMVRILDKMCKIEGWGCCQLHGSMDPGKRHKQIEEFGANPETNILISTLTSGGVGLNLVMASRVLLIDLWWNSSVEHQAFCRLFRRGQERETVMRRLAIHESVDRAIVDMQERKDAEIRAVMEDDKQKALSTEELMQLFGTVKSDVNGNPYIVVDEDRSRANEVLHQLDDDDISGDEM